MLIIIKWYWSRCLELLDCIGPGAESYYVDDIGPGAESYWTTLILVLHVSSNTSFDLMLGVIIHYTVLILVLGVIIQRWSWGRESLDSITLGAGSY